MGGLFGSMGTALGALSLNQEALDITTNNIANINTPGYSRQVAGISENTPITYANLQFGQGAQITGIQSIRDQVLQTRIYSETQQQAGSNAFLGPMQQVQASFNDAGGTGLQKSMTAFFSSWALLSVNPSDIPSRQGVITAGKNLATTFNSAAKNLTVLRGNLNQQVPGDIQQINTIAQSVAKLNLQIANARNSGQNSGTLEDQRNALIQNLSQIVGVSVTNGNNGQISLSTGQGSALVVEGQSFALQAQSDPASGMTHIISNGNDITSQISGGQLGGTLQARDRAIPNLQTQLDTLASGIAAAVNTAHQAGTDLNGAPGQGFFSVPATTPGTAAVMSVNIQDPALIAAGQSGASGDNSNALALSGLQNQNIVAGQSANNYYINTVSQLGNDISSAQTSSDAQTAVLQQLKTQQSSVSGVSLDEEAANLVQFQRAYQASARVITIVDQLTSVAINMGAP